jgi:2-polyprenyl-3-methyl-5-hydroxy-6-metoxy-1,4-benzoquinol methylase
MHEELERAKYVRVWSDPKYRRQCDGLAMVERVRYAFGMIPGQSVIDWGAGTGLAAEEWRRLGHPVTAFDIAPNCLNEDLHHIPLVCGVLWDPPTGLASDFGFCTDVLEHLPVEHVRESLAQIAARSRIGAFLQVDTVLDISGPRMDPPERLHLTVWSREIWEGAIREYWRDVQVVRGTYSRWGFLCRP